MENNEQNQKNGFLPGMLVGILMGMVLLSGVFLGVRLYQYNQTRRSADQGETEAASVINSDTLAKMQTIEKLIDETFYGDEVTTKQLQDGVYKGMVESLNDPYSE